MAHFMHLNNDQHYHRIYLYKERITTHIAIPEYYIDDHDPQLKILSHIWPVIVCKLISITAR